MRNCEAGQEQEPSFARQARRCRREGAVSQVRRVRSRAPSRGRSDPDSTTRDPSGTHTYQEDPREHTVATIPFNTALGAARSRRDGATPSIRAAVLVWHLGAAALLRLGTRVALRRRECILHARLRPASWEAGSNTVNESLRSVHCQYRVRLCQPPSISSACRQDSPSSGARWRESRRAPSWSRDASCVGDHARLR